MKDQTDRPLAALRFTLPDLRAAFADGLPARAVMEEALARIAAVGDPGIFLHRLPDAELLAAADALGGRDPAKPLWGIPFVVKDNIDVAMMPTTAGCPAYAYTPVEDAFVVARLRAAGAIPLGKTNLDQFATGLVGTRSPHSPPLNALDPEIVPGGSSSGSAVAVAHGIVPFALGTDTAGSGRVPAALNGIVGLKPSLGALSASGVVPACRTLDTISIFATEIADAHEVFRIAAAYDPADAYSRAIPSPALAAPLPAPRIAIPDPHSLMTFGDTVQADAFAGSCAALAASGARVEEIDFTPFYDVARMLYEGAWLAERLTVIEELLARDPQAVHPVTRKVVEPAAGMSAADAFRGIYRLAELRRVCEPTLGTYDMLCVPTIPTFYSMAELAEDPLVPNANLGTYTNFVNLLDLCALTVPTGTRSDGRPASVTLIGPSGADAKLASEALRLLTRGQDKHAKASAEPSELTIAVCGAHMSGLPLNSSLTARGGRFLESIRTAPAYRFYALAGDPPARPGLVRETDGASIGLELWALPLPQVGKFLSEIPAPLGLGRVSLEDGRDVTGFVCEAIETPQARDITSFGDWRSYLASLG